jgi:hypothetical protein
MSFNACAVVFVLHALLLYGVTYRYGGVLYEVTVPTPYVETTCVPTSVRKPQISLSDFDKIQYGISLKKKKNLSRKLEFRENRLGENHTLLMGINGFLSLLLMFLNRFVLNLVRKICTLALENSEFPEIRCSESHRPTLHVTRHGGWC